MLSQILTISRNTFVESVRQPIYFILIVICGLAQLFTTWTAAYSMGYSDTSEVSGDDKVLLDLGMATVFVCGLLLSAFLATAVISKEIDNKTVLTVVSKPVSRVSVVLGKYVGVSLAILIAVITMLMFLQMGLRHKVMATAADELDGPVIVFTLAALVLSLGIAVWCNFFYNWAFTQIATMLLCPFMVLAWVGTLLIGKKWQIQPIDTDFKTQIALASVCMVCSQLVFASVATAASARLGQVMTIVVCIGVFMLGLVSNYFVGRHAIHNEFIARVLSAKPPSVAMEGLKAPGDTYTITLELEPRFKLREGQSIYYGPNPSGWGLVVQPFPEFKGDINDSFQRSDLTKPAGLSVSRYSGKEVDVVRVGGPGEILSRPPQAKDYLFTKPTQVNMAALGLWAALPNFQNFWLVDAVSQNQKIPGQHVLMVALYSLCLMGAFLSLAVALFQTREVG